MEQDIRSRRNQARRRRARREQRRKKRLKRLMVLLTLLVVIVVSCVGGVIWAVGFFANPIEKGTDYLVAEEYESAIEQFEKAIEKENNVKEAYRGIGLAHWELGNKKEAVEALEQALVLDAEKTGTMYQLMADYAMEEERFEDALGYIKEGLSCVGNSDALIQELKFNEIVCYEKLVDWESAKTKVSEYIIQYPEDEAAQKEAEFLETR